MCGLCNDDMKSVRVLLAGKIVGLLPKEDDTDLEIVTSTVLQQHAETISRVNLEESQNILACDEIKQRFVNGVRKVLPTISPEARFRLALEAGAVKLT